MSYFHYSNGQLCAEGVPLGDITKDVDTPVYVYSASALADNYHGFSRACEPMDALIAYSVKANSNLAVLTLLASCGAGADVVSGGELERALRAGIAPQKIVFSGVGKSRDEMHKALKVGIYQFNIESAPELIALNDVACALNTRAAIALRINPDVSAGGHEKISTGKAENKFGVNLDQARGVYKQARELPGIEVIGVDMHIGSQIDSLAPFETALLKGLDLVRELRRDGHDIRTFDMGGGLGIVYNQDEDTLPTVTDYMDMVRRHTAGLGLKMIFEPGRAIAGNAGVLLSRVQYVKHGSARNFLILDAAMNDLLRPALYGAYHAIQPVKEPMSDQTEIYDIVGPVCETGDTFATHRRLSVMQSDDLVAMLSAGAYGAVQAGQYNTRPLVPEVLVKDSQFSVIRMRPDLEDILRLESVPGWFGA
ncbi:MAG: diaminopimelate decarboxylase [Robiginitomaculum sp.]|nr:diaminopimelate decarboxylase [Robiginitomaculum sp.]MDQ7078433.1 diaminopimelate decarboxylase [Robiginitomaculum sp.]